MAIIAVQNLVKKYGNFTAVDGTSFEVMEGEIFGLLGPNGAGKTTTLEILETLRPKTAGTVTICGYDLDKNPQEIKQAIGVQLQYSGFYPNLNLKEILELFAGLYNKKIDTVDFLTKVDLIDKAKSKYKELSGGQKQRFSLATTLINDPTIVFLDEPTTGLDPQARRNLWDLIIELKNKGTTVVMTTHYMEEAEQLCDRLAIMNEGKIIAIDTPTQLKEDLIQTGFQKKVSPQLADLDDVFLYLTKKKI